MIQDIMVLIDSLEYPTNFIVLQLKAKFNSYPLILVIPWLATTNAYVSCRVSNMTITNRQSHKQLVLYSHAQPLVEANFLFGWKMKKKIIPSFYHPMICVRLEG